MLRTYSITEARNHFTEVVHEAEAEGPVTLTRRGRPVAVVLALNEFQRLRSARPGFWDAAKAFRASTDISDLALGEVYRGIREHCPGRSIEA